jgi:hypothetical protein
MRVVCCSASWEISSLAAVDDVTGHWPWEKSPEFVYEDIKERVDRRQKAAVDSVTVLNLRRASG